MHKYCIRKKGFNNFFHGIVKSLALGTAAPWVSSVLGTGHLFGCISLPAQPPLADLFYSRHLTEAGEPSISVSVVAGAPSAAE